jgi:hypothetical protein
MTPPSLGCLARMRSSRLVLRRSNSRRAEDPGVPGFDDVRSRPTRVDWWLPQRTTLSVPF